MDKIKATLPGNLPLRIRRFAISLTIIACGLVLRLTGYEIGLPYFFVKYGGSLLWGMMVFWLLAMLLPSRSIRRVAALALVVAALTEFSRLYHTPWLDSFRLTFAGALLLGRIFSWGNILAYSLGIIIAAVVETRLLASRLGTRP
ncbi:DUF2809 domain-containing protein [Agrobacterium sp. ES01]|uniref:ribosomal maturation YjgA family protein n=1 Tax=Agrobacterium sp. ES01 TaxID=3420714 RepID=UPI003D113ADA